MSHARDIKAKRVIIELDKPRTLLFTMNSFVELEDMYGSFEEAMKQMQKGSVKAIRAVLWAGLIHEDPTLTPQKVGAMIDLATLASITDKLSEAIGDALPEPATEDGTVESQVNPQ